MDETFIIVSIIGLVGAILTTQLWQMNWFKRENFKLQKSNILAENRIKLKKLERDLGISKVKNPIPQEQKGLMELLGGLDKDKISGILGLLGESEEPQEEESEIGKLISNLPPGVIEGFLESIKKPPGEKGGGDDGIVYNF